MRDNRVLSRRQVLAATAAVGTLAAAGGVAAAVAPTREAVALDGSADVALGANARPDAQYGFMVRVDRCTNCQECVKACRRANGTPDGAKSRRKVTEYYVKGEGTFHISTSCMHCEHPACADVCPAGAISKGAGGIVTVDHERCIGCKYCYQACPYGVPTYNEHGMDKCDACLEAGVKLGETPNCVAACKFRALHYGPIDELEAAASGRVRKLDSATGPSFLLQ